MNNRKEKRKQAHLVIALKHSPFCVSDEYLTSLPIQVQLALHETYIQRRIRGKSEQNSLASKRLELLNYMNSITNAGNKNQLWLEVKRQLLKYYQR
jgi:hypothetical protein